MVTASINRERRPSARVDSEDDEKNNRPFRNRLDRLYLENSQSISSSHPRYSSNRTQSPLSSRDMYMPSNTVPVYRHGRKFYVSVEEFERMRAEERRHRRILMQKSQNLPVPKSHQPNSRSSSTSFYNSVQRSTSHPHDYRYGVLRAPHLPANPIILSNNGQDSTRPSRSTSRFDNRDDVLSIPSAVPIRLPTTTVRSNSSDKILDLRRTPEPTQSSYSGYVSDDYAVKRSSSAEILQASQGQQQPPVQPRRQVPTPTYDYDRSAVSSFPQNSIDPPYTQSNASKLTNYFSRMPLSTIDSSMNPQGPNSTGSSSVFDTDVNDPEHVYTIRSASNQRRGTGNLTRSSSNHSHNEYLFRDTTSGSFSDDNSSSPPMFIQRRNTDKSRYRRAELVVKTDDDDEQQSQFWARPTARSRSNDGLTEKKRVRFADMEGLTLETVPDGEQRRSSTDNRLLIRRTHFDESNDLRRAIQPLHDSFYHTNTRLAGSSESKLATDV